MIKCRVPNMYIDNCAVQNVLAVARNCQVSVSVPISGSKYQNSPIWFTVISSFIKFLLGYFRFLVKKSPFKYPSKVFVAGVDRTIAEIVPVYSIYDRNSHYCSKKAKLPTKVLVSETKWHLNHTQIVKDDQISRDYLKLFQDVSWIWWNQYNYNRKTPQH